MRKTLSYEEKVLTFKKSICSCFYLSLFARFLEFLNVLSDEAESITCSSVGVYNQPFIIRLINDGENAMIINDTSLLDDTLG